MKNKNIFTFVLATAVVMFFSACQKEKSSINMSANIVTYGNNGSKVYVDITLYWMDYIWVRSVSVFHEAHLYKTPSYLSVYQSSSNIADKPSARLCVHHITKRKERQFYQNYRSFL